ncbi:MAG: MBL fold metallo-hydrolase, partial [Ktedonobacteraceae bacterium]|nr:MBL fold metallo-hydrolase [Ktedonobacteraceae bacterium]
MHSDDTHRLATEDGEMHPRLVHTITDRFSMANTYIINEEQMIIVDPGNDLNVRQIQKYLTTFLQRPLSHIDLVVLTHLHSDHTAGVEALRRVCAAPV